MATLFVASAAAVADDLVADFLGVLEKYDERKYSVLREKVVQGDAEIAVGLGNALKGQVSQRVEVECASVLAEMKCPKATEILRAVVVDGSGAIRWTVAGALLQKSDAESLPPKTRAALAGAVAAAQDERAITAVGLLARDPSVTAAELVVTVLEPMRKRAGAASSESASQVLNETLEFMARVVKRLMAKPGLVDAMKAYGQTHKDDPRWAEFGARWELFIRANSGDASTASAILQCAQDEALPAGVRAMFIRCMPGTCGEQGRAVLEKLAAPLEEAIRNKTYSPAPHGDRKPEWIIGRAARAALLQMDREKGDTPKSGGK